MFNKTKLSPLKTLVCTVLLVALANSVLSVSASENERSGRQKRQLQILCTQNGLQAHPTDPDKVKAS